MPRVLLIIAPKNFRDEEYFETKEVLEGNGIETATASKTIGSKTGMLGGTAKAELVLDKVNENEYDGVVFVGGTGASIYFNDSKAIAIAKEAFGKNKIVAAICIAPSILANAGILNGKKATSFPSERGNLTARGAKYTGEDVTTDGRIITASGPQAARKFGEEISKLLV